jgi:hypothetical protein
LAAEGADVLITGRKQQGIGDAINTMTRAGQP